MLLKHLYHMLKYFKVVLGLYRLSTLRAKFLELAGNKRRFFLNENKGTPMFFEPKDIGPAIPEVNVQQTGKMRIYYIVHCFYPFSQGGTERFIYNIASQSKKDGNDVKVITYNAFMPRSHFTDRHQSILYHRYEFDGLQVIEYRHIKAPPGIVKDILLDDPDTISFADFLFGTERPDLVHFGYLQKVSSFYTSCKRNSIPYMLTFTSYFSLCHYDIMIDGNGGFCSGSDRGRRCMKACPNSDIADGMCRYEKASVLLKGASCLVTPSYFVKRVIEGEFDGLHVNVNPHAISSSFFLKDRKKDITGCGKAQAAFAFIGKISPLKGVHVLIEAFRLLPGPHTLDIYGTGSDLYQSRLESRAKGCPNIRFHGVVSYIKMKEIYESCDIVVIPSLWYETYNFVLHEALFMQKIVIASRLGAMPEHIRTGENGFLFDAGDPTSLKAAMEKAVSLISDGYRGAQDLTVNEHEEYALYRKFYEIMLAERLL